MAVILHNIIEGMSLYIVSSDIISGLFMCLGIGLHNIPLGLIIASTLYNSNYSKKDTIKIYNYMIMDKYIKKERVSWQKILRNLA